MTEDRELLLAELIAAYALPEGAYPAMRELAGIIEHEKDAEIADLEVGLEKSAMWASQLYDELQAEFVKARRSAGTWVPVGERMPEMEAWVVIIDDFGELYSARRFGDFGQWEDREYDLSIPTHWLDVKLPGEQRVDQVE